ncbi:isocitrate lyase/PEP mutase family protein [Streptacidiphilus rugosus]|uniref:isocitrate lyase/PEP mutase family protein n=1 Tax=Streptacidiphilus rugosus TaxID=405783 RepID=UPI00055C370F|nr:isocitrate lyase/phosphoenolpyruvate mutase family protein [Streptacidiphilus rugosus]
MSVDASPGTREKALRLRALADSSLLVLPNAWDAGSAAVIASTGAPVVATTSGGVAWSLGRGDGQHASREAMVAAARRVVAAVDVPVTVDAEGGYGAEPDAVATTVTALVAAGAVGANLEDSRAVGGPLFSADDQAARLRAAREAATSAGLPEFWLNARTDVFLFGIGEPEDRLADVLLRAKAYAAAGADGIFVPGLLDLDALRELCAASPLPVNAMLVPGGPTVPELAATGVRRVSAGTALAQSAYGAARQAAAELLGPGTLTSLDAGLGFGELNGLFDA